MNIKKKIIRAGRSRNWAKLLEAKKFPIGNNRLNLSNRVEELIGKKEPKLTLQGTERNILEWGQDKLTKRYAILI